jgi:hypothetical protein
MDEARTARRSALCKLRPEGDWQCSLDERPPACVSRRYSMRAAWVAASPLYEQMEGIVATGRMAPLVEKESN